MDLENSLHEERASFLRKAKNYVVETVISKAYWVDTLSGYSWFAPLYTFNEKILNGMTAGEILKRRIIGFGLCLVTTRPLCKVRDAWRKYIWKVNENNPGTRGKLADLTLTLGVIPILYGIVLGIGCIGEDKSLMETLETGWEGSALVFGSLPFFVKYLDYNRKKFGTLPLEEELLQKNK